jgi:hypothetical protein
MARDQDAKLLELRATAGLARLLGETGQRGSARELLATVVLGGIVSFGSNVSTLRQTTAAMSAGVLRSDLISRVDLRVVGDGTMKRI